jgi:hypothetical protein
MRRCENDEERGSRNRDEEEAIASPVGTWLIESRYKAVSID